MEMICNFKVIMLLTAFWVTGGIRAQETAEKLIGRWANEDDSRTIEIYKIEGRFYGKIISQNRRQKAKVGDIVLKDFKYDGSGWVGVIYAPARAQEIGGTIAMPDPDTLVIGATGGLQKRVKYWHRISLSSTGSK